jgi:hypothetical protein
MYTNRQPKDLLNFDKAFPYFDDFGKFDILSTIPSDVNFNESNDGLLMPPIIIITDILTRYGYAEISQDKYFTYFAELTDKGREAKSAGGHFSHLKKLAEKEQKERERQHKADEISKYDLLHKKYFYKSRYAPHIFSGLALIGTAFSLFIAYKALHKADLPLIPLTTDTAEYNTENKILLQTDTTLKKKDTLLHQ